MKINAAGEMYLHNFIPSSLNICQDYYVRIIIAQCFLLYRQLGLSYRSDPTGPGLSEFSNS